MYQLKASGDNRTLEQLRQHYAVERELAEKLRSAAKEERRHLYQSLYDELFRRVPHHPQLTQKADAASRKRDVDMQFSLLKQFVHPRDTVLEVGPGDCALAAAAAGFVRTVYAVDVSREISSSSSPLPENLYMLFSDGCSIPVPGKSINVAYSNQLMEHLHPDDAWEQMQNIYAALVPGGLYLCITPNRLSGPYDISMFFDKTATGFHLKEYTAGELGKLFIKAGFTRIRLVLGAGRARPIMMPVFPAAALERCLAVTPWSMRRELALRAPLSTLRVIRMAGMKAL